MEDISKRLFEKMKRMQGAENLKLPPNCTVEMQGKIIAYEEGEYLTCSFPILEKYNNPAGVMLGGFLPVFFDLTMGPFVYLEANKPSTSLDLNVTFIKPISTLDNHILVTVHLIKKSKHYLILEGKANNPKGEIVGAATSRLLILDKKNI